MMSCHDAVFPFSDDWSSPFYTPVDCWVSSIEKYQCCLLFVLNHIIMVCYWIWWVSYVLDISQFLFLQIFPPLCTFSFHFIDYFIVHAEAISLMLSCLNFSFVHLGSNPRNHYYNQCQETFSYTLIYELYSFSPKLCSIWSWYKIGEWFHSFAFEHSFPNVTY